MHQLTWFMFGFAAGTFVVSAVFSIAVVQVLKEHLSDDDGEKWKRGGR